MSIEVRVAVKEELENWDTYIEASPNGTIFHMLDWLKVTEKHTRSALYPLIGLKGNEVIGIFPVFYKKKGSLKMVFSPPYHAAIPYLGPVLIGYDQLKQEKKESLSTAFYTGVDNFLSEKIKPNYVNFKSLLLDCRSFKWLGYQIEPEYDYILDISIGMSKLESNFTYRTRKNIEKAEQDGLRVELGSKEELLAIYDLLYDRYAEQKTAISITENYLLDLYDYFFPDNLKVFTVRHNDTIISGGVELCHKDKILAWLGQPKTNTRGPNDLLRREVMKWGIENGYRYYNILGANTPGINRFKSKFNPELDIYFEIKKATLSGLVAETLYTKTKSHLYNYSL